MNKYIVTVESRKGIEIICRPRNGPFVSKEQAEDFVLRHIKEFPWLKYRIYELRQVEESAVELRF